MCPKTHWGRLEARLEAKIAAVGAKIDRRIAELEAKMLRYMLGRRRPSVAIVFGLLRLLK